MAEKSIQMMIDTSDEVGMADIVLKRPQILADIKPEYYRRVIKACIKHCDDQAIDVVMKFADLHIAKLDLQLLSFTDLIEKHSSKSKYYMHIKRTFGGCSFFFSFDKIGYSLKKTTIKEIYRLDVPQEIIDIIDYKSGICFSDELYELIPEVFSILPRDYDEIYYIAIGKYVLYMDRYKPFIESFDDFKRQIGGELYGSSDEHEITTLELSKTKVIFHQDIEYKCQY